MRMISLFALLVVLCLPAATLADSPDPQRGKEFAQANCAQCHSIERTGSSPRSPRLPFANSITAILWRRSRNHLPKASSLDTPTCLSSN
jgi:Cytochrome c